MFQVYLYYFLMGSVKMKCCGKETCSVTSSYLLTEAIWGILSYFDVVNQLSLLPLFLSYCISSLLLARIILSFV